MSDRLSVRTYMYIHLLYWQWNVRSAEILFDRRGGYSHDRIHLAMTGAPTACRGRPPDGRFYEIRLSSWGFGWRGTQRRRAK